MIDSETAQQIVVREIQQSPAMFAPMFIPWQRASLGEPVMVADVWKQPSYWLIPVELGRQVIGFARVLSTGQLSAVGAFYKDPDQLDSCPLLVTGIDASEAANQATSRVNPAQGEIALDPKYVHDGPPGREAWLVEVVKDDKPIRWVFVTPGGLYERHTGTLLEEGYE